MSHMGEGWSSKENPNVFVRVEVDDACHSFDSTFIFSSLSSLSFVFVSPTHCSLQCTEFRTWCTRLPTCPVPNWTVGHWVNQRAVQKALGGFRPVYDCPSSQLRYKISPSFIRWLWRSENYRKGRNTYELFHRGPRIRLVTSQLCEGRIRSLDTPVIPS